MSTTSLVRYSRDGDQFHYLWAARRCLQLLSADGYLVAVGIEGASPKEGVAEPAMNAGEEVIDIAEYFGDENFEKAHLIHYMQLKHSTQRASKPWTASGLEKTIKGFAKRYRELLKTVAADILAKKLKFSFVTNRPIGDAFLEAVADAAAKNLPRHPDELQKLERFTGLSKDTLAAFSKLLHFEGRQDDYWDQRHILFQEVRNYLPDADVDGPSNLKELVTRRALSEGENNPTITKIDVLRALNTDENLLYPAPCLIDSVGVAVPRDQEPHLIRVIVEATAPIVIHASAGVGKTVFATRIEGGLPDGSTCILYDCFGNGQYRSASAYRHRHKDALVQIANELAARKLCHLLIPTSRADASDYVRAFVGRIKQAATLVRLASPQALLCVVVDAADNAETAAEEIGETRSFVRDLIREKIPDNVRLVFLCRSHRQDHLDPPAETVRLELQPFSCGETAAYLRKRFADASERDIDEFHRLSSQNPRVQALALSRTMTLPDTLRLLGPNPTTVDAAIGSLLEGAIARLKDSVTAVEKSQVDKICAGLATLRPRIPIPILSKISAVAEEAIRSFAIDLGRPLHVVGETIQFFDEPAETWFRERFRPPADAMETFIATLKPLAAASAYVASVVPQLMLEAGKFPELVELALTSAALPETNSLERRDIELQRLQFALKAGLRSARFLDAAKLALKAGGESAGDDRQRTILQANTDLAATFLETDLIQEIVSRWTFRSGWLGSHHAYEAALLSGCPELVGDARSRLRMAYGWLDNWSRLNPKEREAEKMSDLDIVELTLADLNIHGPAEGAHSLRRWRPPDVSFRVGRAVARRLIDHGRFEDVEAFARAAGNNLCLILAITVELREILRPPPADVTQRTFRLVARTSTKLSGGHTREDRESSLDAVTALVEAALQHAVCSADDAAAVLSRYLPSEPPRALSSRYSKARFPMLRAYCLRAALQGQVLTLDDLAHAELRAKIDRKNQHSTSRELLEFREDIGALLPWHQLWVETLLGGVTKASLGEELQRTREASKNASKTDYRDESATVNEIALLWLDLLHRLDAADATTLATFSQWKDGLKRPLFTPTLTALARLCGQKEATKATSIDLAQEAFQLIREERSDAESKANEYINIARAVLGVSRADAKGYFDEAVEVASKIGNENLSRWDSILDLADRAARATRPSPEMAYRLARCAELTYSYVVRDKHFDWKGTVEALVGLCPSSALAILSRWRDRGFGWSERILPIAVERLIACCSLDARDALPLVGFRARWSYDRILASVLANCARAEEKEAAAAHLYRYLRFSGGDFRKLKEVASGHGVSIAGIDEIIAFDESAKRVTPGLSDHRVAEADTLRSQPARNWDVVLAGCDLTNADGLARAYRVFKNTEPPWDHDQFFKEVISRVPVGSEAAFVNAVGYTTQFELYHFQIFLEHVPDRWGNRPATQRALEETLKIFCCRCCMKIAIHRDYEAFPFTRAGELIGIGKADIVSIVLRAVGETPGNVDYNRFFSLVGLLAIKLSEDEALDALRVGLDLFDPVLEDKDGDGPWSHQLVPPTDIKASLAGYIWASLAAPEAVLRWEGAHVVSGLVALGRQDVLGHVVKFATEQQGGPFVDARLAFYRLHAQQWFLIGIARAAIEYPGALAPIADQIVDWALKDQTHVMIRQFAARAALALVNNGVLENYGNLKERLARINTSSHPVIESNSYDRIRHQTNGAPPLKDDDRFYFGHDIGSYWYAPLGRVFALSQNDIESEALRVIRSDLGVLAKGRWDRDERWRRKLYEENHTHHSHGSYPRADTLDFYHAYHAMMIVAGKLLASPPTHRNTDYGEEDEFVDWLARHDLSRKDGRWLWDRRDPLPLERSCRQDREQKEGAWQIVTCNDFDEALHVDGMLNIWGDWTAADSRWEQSTQVYSALVSPDKSPALLRALGTAKDVHDYALPSAGSDMEIDKPGFELKGWIVNHSGGRGLDEHDRWAGGISFPPPRPARHIIDLMGLETDPESRFWKDPKNRL